MLMKFILILGKKLDRYYVGQNIANYRYSIQIENDDVQNVIEDSIMLWYNEVEYYSRYDVRSFK